tara:strand:- start:37436 stop:38881 length:1446 start_codon:yes stop_codon:yes gene_type:complete
LPVDLTSDFKQLKQCLPFEQLSPQVRAFLMQPAYQSSPWAVACSGGADSVCLLLSLLAHFPEQAGNIHVLHVNHRLRGLASDGDEQFVRELAQDLGLPFYTHQHEDGATDTSEAALREVRQAFFKETLQQIGASILFTAHHKSDVAETLLMRLVRGSGSSSLAGPRPIQSFSDGRVYLRPLLEFTKQDLLSTLHKCRIAFRYDETNAMGDYFRNRIRSSVVPALQSASPNDPLEGLALSRRLLEEDDAALNAVLRTLITQPQVNAPWDLSKLMGQPTALWRRALQLWLRVHNKTQCLSRKAFELLLEACQKNYASFTLSAGKDVFIVLKDKQLQFKRTFEQRPSPFSFSLNLGDVLPLPNGAVLEAHWVSLDEATRAAILAGHMDNGTTAYLNIDPGAVLTARSWISGDAYRPLGAPGTQKFQDLFINRKIPSGLRSALPIISKGENEILWCPGLPPADAYKLLPSTSEALRLTYLHSLVE